MQGTGSRCSKRRPGKRQRAALKQPPVPLDLAEREDTRPAVWGGGGAQKCYLGVNQAERFPEDFAFPLSGLEVTALKSQIVTSNDRRVTGRLVNASDPG